MVDADAQPTSPVEPLEAIVAEAQEGSKTKAELVEAFLNATLVVPSGTDPSREPLQPVVVDVEGTPHVAVFASLPAAVRTGQIARYAASLQGRDVIRAVQPGYGVLVGTVASGFDLSPEILEELRDRSKR